MSSRKERTLLWLSAMMGMAATAAPMPAGRRKPLPHRAPRGGKCPKCRYPLGGAICRKIHETEPKKPA